MTAQIRDAIVFATPARPSGDESIWTIERVAGSGLFEPEAHRLRVTSPHTACVRGYHCEYAIRDGELLLTSVSCGLPDAYVRKVAQGTPPTVFGAPLRERRSLRRPFDPTTGQLGPEEMSSTGEFFADGLAAPMDFTGGMLLCRDAINEHAWYSVHLHNVVIEVRFERGRVVETTDHSEAMAQYRLAVDEWSRLPRRPWLQRWLRPLPTDAAPLSPLAHYRGVLVKRRERDR